eukprot:TRINITY_DN42199_c0_g1_i1.p1 TRINITY_DN42199_c0_g1~~TRINITY_DN42199_c0_g1_i1.p1  ORF type:complete len:136 (+),score=20.84 TRINITY_DN42199_c0_g1_i1:88-495(+)
MCIRDSTSHGTPEFHFHKLGHYRNQVMLSPGDTSKLRQNNRNGKKRHDFFYWSWTLKGKVGTLEVWPVLTSYYNVPTKDISAVFEAAVSAACKNNGDTLGILQDVLFLDDLRFTASTPSVGGKTSVDASAIVPEA